MISENFNKIKLTKTLAEYFISTLNSFLVFSGADLVALINKARTIALKQIIEMNNLNITAIMPEHFDLAMEMVKPSVGKKDRIRYVKLKKVFGTKLIK